MRLMWLTEEERMAVTALEIGLLTLIVGVCAVWGFVDIVIRITEGWGS